MKFCDVVNLQTPLCPSTERIFSDEMFAHMKRGTHLIHTARGALCAVMRRCAPCKAASWQAVRATCGFPAGGSSPITGRACAIALPAPR